MATAPEPDVAQTMTLLQSLVTSPEQQGLLTWMQGQPKETLIPFLKNAMAQIPRDQLPNMVNEHMAAHPAETRNQVYHQIVQAYDFLSAM